MTTTVNMDKEMILFGLLETVNLETMWGLAIRQAMKDCSYDDFLSLVADLKSKARDNPTIMEEILGSDCYRALMAV